MGGNHRNHAPVPQSLHRQLERLALGAAVCLASALLPPVTYAQSGKTPGKMRDLFIEPDLGEKFSQKLAQYVPKIDDAEAEIKVVMGRARVLHARANVTRSYVADPEVVDIVPFAPKEYGLQGLRRGATTVTFWFEDENDPLTISVKVIRDPETENMRDRDYQILEAKLSEMFPNSHIRLVPVANKVVLMGQARDAKEATEIYDIVSSRGSRGLGGAGGFDDRFNGNGRGNNPGFSGAGSAFGGDVAADPFGDRQSDTPPAVVVNMLRIPGEHTVNLRVKIAELNRSVLRDLGVNFTASLGQGGKTLIESLLSGQGTLNVNFDSGDVRFAIRALESNGTLRILSEQNLATLSGEWASFTSGGEFAVPTIVGLGTNQAIATQFRGFGAIVDFLPTVIDKDRIRLVLLPEFSQLNSANTANGTPGLDTRSARTTVELRAGQTYAIASLVQDTTQNENDRIPFLGDIPIIGTLFSARHSTHNERELLILVTPTLVSPMEPDEVPPLPGYDVTEPNDWELYFWGRTEGHAGSDWRSTIWPINWTRIRDYKRAESRYISGPAGHSMPDYPGDYGGGYYSDPGPMGGPGPDDYGRTMRARTGAAGAPATQSVARSPSAPSGYRPASSSSAMNDPARPQFPTPPQRTFHTRGPSSTPSNGYDPGSPSTIGNRWSGNGADSSTYR